MKTTTLLKITLAGFFLLTLNSCSKMNDNSENSPGYTIEYRIYPLNNDIVSITYTDSTGKNAECSLDHFTNGSKKINVSRLPFDALLSADVMNSSGEPIAFLLSISVNGKEMKFSNFTAEPYWPNIGVTKSVEYEVQ
jgi:hypothetical protein